MGIAKIDLFDRVRKYEKIIFVSFVAIIIYFIAAVYNDVFVNLMSISNFLAWHTIFEFASILVSFSIFTVTYFIYEEFRNLKMIIFGCVFLLMGFLDIFHTLSYKGMADFFIVNDTANRATTLWILARLLGSLGFMIATLIPSDKASNIKKEVFISVTSILSIGLFLIVTYFPNFFPPMFTEGEGLTYIKIIIEYIIIAILAITFIVIAYEYEKTSNNREYMTMIAIILLVFSEFAFTNYGSIYDAFNYVGHFFKVIAYITLYRAIYLENIRVPYRELRKTRNELKRYSEHLDVLVEKRTKELKDLNKVLLADIEYAKETQHCLLPAQMPKDSSVSFNAEYFIAERLSGDFYNVIRLDEDNIALYIGDVSGHGVSAAMLTVFANQNVLQLKEKDPSTGEFIDPGFVLKNIFNSFNKTNISSEKYILMLYGIYNTKTKCFTYSSAGINVPPYIIKKSGELINMNVKGLPICKLGELIEPYYDNETIQLETGDKILFYSDGLVEAKNKENEVYGEEKLEILLKENYKLNSSKLNAVIKNDLFSHMGFGEELMDDTTLLIMEITK